VNLREIEVSDYYLWHIGKMAGKLVGGQNNLRFYGLNLVVNFAAVGIEIGGESWRREYIFHAPARAIHFIGCQIHLSGAGWEPHDKKAMYDSFSRTYK